MYARTIMVRAPVPSQYEPVPSQNPGTGAARTISEFGNNELLLKELVHVQLLQDLFVLPFINLLTPHQIYLLLHFIHFELGVKG